MFELLRELSSGLFRGFKPIYNYSDKSFMFLEPFSWISRMIDVDELEKCKTNAEVKEVGIEWLQFSKCKAMIKKMMFHRLTFLYNGARRDTTYKIAKGRFFKFRSSLWPRFAVSQNRNTMCSKN